MERSRNPQALRVVRMFLAAALCAVLALCASACSGGKASEQSAASPQSTSASTSASQAPSGGSAASSQSSAEASAQSSQRSAEAAAASGKNQSSSDKEQSNAQSQNTSSSASSSESSQVSSTPGATAAASSQGAQNRQDAQAPPAVTEHGHYTSKEEVAAYIHKFGHLPENFVSKTKARKAGWVSSKGNLDEVLPGMSIGGSVFYNDEGKLPDARGRTWTECDINYEGGYRGAERIVFSDDGLIFYTGDHYETFEQLY